MTNPYDPGNPSNNRDNTGGGVPSYGDYVGGGNGGEGYGANFGYGQPSYDPASLSPADSYPGPGRRLGAFLIDSVLFFIVIMILSAFFFAGDFTDYMDEYTTWLDAGQTGPEPELSLSGLYIVAALSLVLWFAYRIVMEITTGKTLGKMAVGVKVVNADGNLLSAKDSFIRNSWYLAVIVLGWIPVIGGIAGIAVYAALGVLIARDPHRQHICDKWAKSYVVNAR
ncbi:RDD family protein [Corynebacterium sp. USCH3]|uniref:RDD family protein n=1 Tax=Corynebacterium sp. USCH3 TaxID=3024840 RepID=UPI0030B3003A